MRRLETYGWWPELVGAKDELSLRELSERFRVTPNAISAALKRTGTERRPTQPGPKAYRKQPDEGSDPASMDEPAWGDHLDAARPGSKDFMIRAYQHLLGKVPDAEVARRAGVSVRTLASFRARHGVSAYTGPRRSAGPAGGRSSRIDPFRELLGQVQDRVVAERAGVSLNAVRNYRVKHAIPAAGRVVAPAHEIGSSSGSMVGVPTAHEAAGSAPGNGAAHVWRIIFREDGEQVVHVITARDLIDAATRAGQVSGGVVLSLSWVGEIL